MGQGQWWLRSSLGSMVRDCGSGLGIGLGGGIIGFMARVKVGGSWMAEVLRLHQQGLCVVRAQLGWSCYSVNF